MSQTSNALAAIDKMIDPGSSHLLLGRLTQADVTAVVAERLARTGQLRIDTDAHMPCLRALTKRLAENPAFNVAEP
jgi:glutathione S-transferase